MLDEPIVVMPQRVLASMIADTQRYMVPETGESLVGLAIPGKEEHKPIFIILGTMPAGKAIRETSLFRLGGDYQYRVFCWLDKNWEALRKSSRSHPQYGAYQWGQSVPTGMIPQLFDHPLIGLGDWHKHPRGFTYPSGGDISTALSLLRDKELDIPCLIAPIVTVRSKAFPKSRWREDLLFHEVSGMHVAISFSYISRRMVKMGVRDFISIIPTIVSDSLIPALPELSWDLADPDRFVTEVELLRDYGCTVEIYPKEFEAGLPLRVCLAIKRKHFTGRPWDHQVIIETGRDHPHTAPIVRIVTGDALSIAEPVPLPKTSLLRRWRKEPALLPLPPLVDNGIANGTFVWRPESTLLNLVMYLERKGKVWKPEHNGTAG